MAVCVRMERKQRRRRGSAEGMVRKVWCGRYGASASEWLIGSVCWGHNRRRTYVRKLLEEQIAIKCIRVVVVSNGGALAYEEC
jgi:hypothetical protein